MRRTTRFLSCLAQMQVDAQNVPAKGTPHTPMPYNDRLELEVIPSQERIVEAIRGLL